MARDQGLFRTPTEARALTGHAAELLYKTIDTFRRHGADLDAAGKSALEAIDVELAHAHDQVLARTSSTPPTPSSW